MEKTTHLPKRKGKRGPVFNFSAVRFNLTDTLTSLPESNSSDSLTIGVFLSKTEGSWEGKKRKQRQESGMCGWNIKCGEFTQDLREDFLSFFNCLSFH